MNKRTNKPTVYINYNDNGKFYTSIAIKVNNANLPFGCSKYPQDAENSDPTVRFSLQVDLNDKLTDLKEKLLKLEELYINFIRTQINNDKTKKLVAGALGVKGKDLKNQRKIDIAVEGMLKNSYVRESAKEDYNDKLKIRVPFYYNKETSKFTTYIKFFDKSKTKLDITNENVTDMVKYGEHHIVFVVKPAYFVGGNSGIPLDLVQMMVLSENKNNNNNTCLFEAEEQTSNNKEESNEEEETQEENNDEDDISESDEE
jgi:hypothetical protein